MKSLQYADRSWNPLTGCDGPFGPGCAHCWARAMANRLHGRVGYPSDHPFRPVLHLDRLDDPTHWKKPQIIATCFMGDISCHPRGHLFDLAHAMRRVPRHTYLILTKIPTCFAGLDWPACCLLGTSVEDQAHYDLRVRVRPCRDRLLDWLSIEPLLGPIRLDLYAPPWIVIGYEHGPKARRTEARWVEDLISDARRLGRRVFFKDDPRMAADLPVRPDGVDLMETGF
ncbi:phage Gp37/Gp68 family protein [Candidatus Bathyarchaeota archaeon]|nr:phage Gp37/Gp68 family protein [Candidatus Bathyarchaeota archaeon]